MEAITGFRMHPAWFRIGGVAHDLPRGWDRLLRVPRLDAETSGVLRESGAAKHHSERSFRALPPMARKRHWSRGTTGAGLRATGIDFDVRKARPYSGYENFDFEIPVGGGVSDCYTRVMLKVEELRQSLHS